MLHIVWSVRARSSSPRAVTGRLNAHPEELEQPRHLAQAEIVFEYRSAETSGPAQQRLKFQRGFFAVYDDLWAAINLRNDVQHYQDGLFVLDIPTFDERSVREALLNAVSHRN